MQEKLQGLETQVEQLQQQLQAVKLETVHEKAQLQVCDVGYYSRACYGAHRQ